MKAQELEKPAARALVKDCDLTKVPLLTPLRDDGVIFLILVLLELLEKAGEDDLPLDGPIDNSRGLRH